MATRFQVKRSSVSGVKPTTTDIQPGELAVNINDGILFSANSTTIFEVGSNLTSIAVGNSTVRFVVNTTHVAIPNGKALLANGSNGTAGQVLTSNGTGVYWSTLTFSVNTAATYSWTNNHSFSSNVNFDSGTLFVDSVANRVGIGTGAGAPTYALDVEIPAAGAQHWFDATEGGPAYYGANGISGAEYRTYVNGFQYGQLVTNSTSFALISTNAVPVILGANNINYVFVAANGNVGVGNSSPAHTLRVDGTISLSGGVHANGSLGTSGHVLHSNGTGVYWAADDQGVTSVSTGSGLTGGDITTSGTISVLANDGITANATGLYVTQGTGLVVNTTGVHVNSDHVATLAGSPTFSSNVTFNQNITVSNSLLAILRSNNEFSVGLRAGTSSAQTSLTNIPVMILHNTDTTNNNGVGIRFNTNDTGGTERTAAGLNAQFTDHTTSSVNADLFFYTTNDSVITEKLRIKSDGNIGIGNSAPAHKLRVEGSLSISGAFVANNSNGTSGQVLTSNGTGVYWSTAAAGSVNTSAQYSWTNTHSFAANVDFDSGTLFVDSVTNRVGVGVGATAPTYALDVEIPAAGAQHWFDGAEGGPAYYGANGISGAEYRTYVSGTQYGRLTTNSTAFALVSTNAVPTILGANNISYIYVSANGNIGIGNSVPTHTLRVQGTLSASGNTTLDNWLDIKNYVETETTPAISAGTLTLNLNNGSVFDVALNGNITTLTISNTPSTAGKAISFVLVFTADGTPRTVAWPASFRWPGGTAPTITSTNTKRDIFTFFSTDNGTSWNAFISGQNL